MKNSILAISLLIACTYAVDLTERCVGDSACSAANAECIRNTETTCVYGTCSCKAGYQAAGTDNKECFQKSSVDGSCNPADKKVCDTDKHLKCTANKCECADGFVKDGAECKPTPVDYDASCFDTLQCTGSGLTNAICSGTPKKCVCAPGYYRDNNACKPKLEFDQDCTTATDNCNELKNLKCISDKCKCSETYFEKDRVCVVGSKGDSCDGTPAKLCGTNMVCTTGTKVCDCVTDYEEKTFNRGGVQVKECIHKDTKIDITLYNKCIENDDDTGRFCVANLLCEQCYAVSSDRVCLAKTPAPTTRAPSTTVKDGATTVSASFSSVAISLISVVVIALRV